jgi:cyclin T
MSSAITHFDISQLPSLKKGMSAEEESMKRRKTCRFIEEAGRVLKLPRVAISTAEVFFHRFYAKHSFQEHDRFEVAVAAIVLAAKTEEAPKKLNTVIQECFKLKARGMQAGRISQQMNPDGSTSPPPPTSAFLDPKGEEFLKLKERILLLERVILHTIGFELSIDHPYKVCWENNGCWLVRYKTTLIYHFHFYFPSSLLIKLKDLFSNENYGTKIQMRHQVAELKRSCPK